MCYDVCCVDLGTYFYTFILCVCSLTLTTLIGWACFFWYTNIRMKLKPTIKTRRVKGKWWPTIRLAELQMWDTPLYTGISWNFFIFPIVKKCLRYVSGSLLRQISWHFTQVHPFEPSFFPLWFKGVSSNAVNLHINHQCIVPGVVQHSIPQSHPVRIWERLPASCYHIVQVMFVMIIDRRRVHSYFFMCLMLLICVFIVSSSVV